MVEGGGAGGNIQWETSEMYSGSSCWPFFRFTFRFLDVLFTPQRQFFLLLFFSCIYFSFFDFIDIASHHPPFLASPLPSPTSQ